MANTNNDIYTRANQMKSNIWAEVWQVISMLLKVVLHVVHIATCFTPTCIK